MPGPDLVQQVMNHEGYRQFPYRCTAGKLTIGFGHNLESEGLPLDVSMTLLTRKLDECEKDLATFPWWVGLSERRRNALIDMRFNLGGGGFRKFRKMLAALEAGDYVEAAAQMRDSKWAREDVPSRAALLARMVESDAL